MSHSGIDKHFVELAVRWRRWHGGRRWGGIILADRFTIIANHGNVLDIHHGNRRSAIPRLADDCACFAEDSNILLVFVDGQLVISHIGIDSDEVGAGSHIIEYCISALTPINFYGVVT